MEDWHNRPAAKLMQELDSGPGGLAEKEAARRLERYGPNELAALKGPSLLARLLGQLGDPMILVLLGAAALSLLSILLHGQVIDTKDHILGRNRNRRAV